MRKDDQYNKLLFNSIVTGTPIPAKKAREIAQYGLSESQIQQSCIRWFQFTYPQLWKDGVMFHVANEGKRSQWQGKKLKLEGVVRGVADLCLAVSRHGFNALYIEMKKPGGYQFKEQKEWQA